MPGDDEGITRKGLKNIDRLSGKETLGGNVIVARDLEHYHFLGSKNNHYDHFIIDAAKKYSIDPAELKSLLQKESGEKINRSNIGSRGEVGAGQLMYNLARDFGLKVIDIEPQVKVRRAEEHRLGYLKEFRKEGTNWQDPEMLKKIEKGLEKAEEKASMPLKDEVKNRNQATREVLRNAAKSGGSELEKAFNTEVEKSQKIIRENSNDRLVEKLRSAGDERLDIKKNILTTARYLSALLKKNGDSYDSAHYEKGEVAYKTGSFLGDPEWIRKGTTTVRDILSSKLYDKSPTLKKEVLGVNGRLESLEKYRQDNIPYKLDKYIFLAQGEKGTGSLEKPNRLALVKDKNGVEKYVSIASGKLYNSIDSASKEFRWQNKKESLMQGEGKTIDETNAKLREIWDRQRQDTQKIPEKSGTKKRELPLIRESKIPKQEKEKKDQPKKPQFQ